MDTTISTAGERAQPGVAEEAPEGGAAIGADEVYQRVGLLTRKLHEALQGLGYDTHLEETASSLPDARARLGYIATLTGRAAERVLTAAEAGREIQERLEKDARAHLARCAGKRRRGLTKAGCDLAARVAEDAARTNAQLGEIMLAQDFHDLTGQVIKRVVDLAQEIEEHLLKLLVDASPFAPRARRAEVPLAAGPVVDGAGRNDVVTDQSQVDDLLASLGF